jgi:CBS domain-containing protein
MPADANTRASGCARCVADLLQGRNPMNTLLVEDVMTKDVVTVRSYAPFREIVQVMLANDIGAVPVVDSMGHAVGIVSRTDLIAKELPGDAGSGQSTVWRLLSADGRKAGAQREATTAGRLMSLNLVTVDAGAGVTRAAYLMRRHDVTHLPVTDEQDMVVGIVSRGDLLRSFLRDDAEIREHVIRDVLIEALDADRDTIEVLVNTGIVTLKGALDRASSAAYAVRATRQVPGVVDVVDELHWKVDDRRPVGGSGKFGPLF